MSTTLPNETAYKAASIMHAGLLRDEAYPDVKSRIKEISTSFRDTVGADIRDAKAFAVRLPQLIENNRWLDNGGGFRILVGDILDFGMNTTPLGLSGMSRDAKMMIFSSKDEFLRSGMSHTGSMTESAVNYLSRTFCKASVELRSDILSAVFITANNYYMELRRKGDRKGSRGASESARLARKTLFEQIDIILSADPEPTVRYWVYKALSGPKFIDA